jgi:CHASE3 domain sensor protein
MGGLISRMVLATGVLLLIVGSAFGVLLISSGDQRQTARMSLQAQDVFVATTQVQRDVNRMQTAQLQYTVTGSAGFLAAWRSAEADLPTATTRLEQTATSPSQRTDSQRIAQTVNAYVDDYARPTITAAQRGDGSVRSERTLIAGNDRLVQLDNQLTPSGRRSATPSSTGRPMTTPGSSRRSLRPWSGCSGR